MVVISVIWLGCVGGDAQDKGDEAVLAAIVEVSCTDDQVPLWWSPGVTQLVLSGALLPLW